MKTIIIRFALMLVFTLAAFTLWNYSPDIAAAIGVPSLLLDIAAGLLAAAGIGFADITAKKAGRKEKPATPVVTITKKEKAFLREV